MLSASVSNIDLYRMWRTNEELNLDWLLTRLYGTVEATPEMNAGKAFHAILEQPDFSEQTELTIKHEGREYWFSILCDIALSMPDIRELPMYKSYGDLLVRGRIDGIVGKAVTDYKTTGSFDGDRFMESYQWKFYLDMLECETFTWKVFVLRPSPTNGQHDGPQQFDITQYHELTQHRYPGMHGDCVKLAADYADFIRANAPKDYLASREKEA